MDGILFFYRSLDEISHASVLLSAVYLKTSYELGFDSNVPASLLHK